MKNPVTSPLQIPRPRFSVSDQIIAKLSDPQNVMVNNGPLIEFITTPAEEASVREHNKTDPVLPHCLPSLSTLEGDAVDQVVRQRVLQERLESALDSELRKPHSNSEAKSLGLDGGLAKKEGDAQKDGNTDNRKGGSSIGSSVGKASPKFEAYHLLRAIDSKDVMLMMEIRDYAFHLFLEASGGNATPLTYAMRLGDKCTSNSHLQVLACADASGRRSGYGGTHYWRVVEEGQFCYR